jgi:hypothetical protein
MLSNSERQFVLELAGWWKNFSAMEVAHLFN